MKNKNIFYRIPRNKLKWISRGIYLLTFILFAIFTIQAINYNIIVALFLFATYCMLVSERNTKDSIEKIMLIVGIVSISIFLYLDFYNTSERVLANYSIADGKVKEITLRNATKNKRSTIHYDFHTDTDRWTHKYEDTSLIPRFKTNELVMVLYKKDEPSQSEIYKNEEEIYNRINSYPYIFAFWDKAYWLRNIVSTFILFGIIPIILTYIQRKR